MSPEKVDREQSLGPTLLNVLGGQTKTQKGEKRERDGESECTGF